MLVQLFHVKRKQNYQPRSYFSVGQGAKFTTQRPSAPALKDASDWRLERVDLCGGIQSAM